MGRRVENMDLPDVTIQTDIVDTGDSGQVTVSVIDSFPGGNAVVSSYTQDVNVFIISYDGASLVIGSSAPNCKVMYRIVSKRVI